ncbi:MAG: hypothetical protein QM217_09020 [Bacillota bacterium]|nr:hypothetical protein [Bacillota bacterium]
MEVSNVDNIILYTILFLAFLLITGLVYIFYQERKKSKMWNGISNTGYRSSRSNLLILRIYRYLNNFPITKSYIHKLSYHYRLICPCDSRTIARRTVSSCLISWLISVFAFILIFLSRRQLISLITAGLAIYIINSEIVSRIAKRHEIKLLTEMQMMLSEVVHYFYIDYRIDHAIYRARDYLGIDMKVVVDEIYQLLISPDREDGLREYYDNIPNKYLRAFVSQCLSLMERGDTILDGKHLFIRNLENLQREIDIEIDKLQRLSMEFMGVILCVVSPIFCIDIVKKFAISLKESMDKFYYGREGFLLDMGLLLIITVIYIVMRKSAEYPAFYQPSHRWLLSLEKIGPVRKAMDNYCVKNASKQERLQKELRNNGISISARFFVLRSFLIATSIFIVSLGITIYLHIYSKNQLFVVSKHEIETLIPSSMDLQYDGITKIIEDYTRRFIERPSIRPETSQELMKIFRKEGIVYNSLIAEALAEEILLRVTRYQEDYITFFEVLVCLCISILAFYTPRILMKYGISRDAMEDEVNQFNAIIGMLMYNQAVTTKQILVEMESFAMVFKASIRMCIDDFSTGDIEALEELKEKEPYEPFRRIVDNLIRCDEMPIYQAFSEISLDQDGYMSKRKLKNEKSIRKRVFRAYLLAALPFILLFAYGLMPALVSSMYEMNQLLGELQGAVW